jgi:hypothetical protein
MVTVPSSFGVTLTGQLGGGAGAVILGLGILSAGVRGLPPSCPLGVRLSDVLSVLLALFVGVGVQGIHMQCQRS